MFRPQFYISRKALKINLSLSFWLISLVVLGLLYGCAAMFVPATNDPMKKLTYANQLIDAGRPLPAETLIRESLDIYRTEGNEMGLAEGYRIYGILFQSYVVTQMKEYYGEHGFKDESATWEKDTTKPLSIFRSQQIYFKNTKSLMRLRMFT